MGKGVKKKGGWVGGGEGGEKGKGEKGEGRDEKIKTSKNQETKKPPHRILTVCL